MKAGEKEKRGEKGILAVSAALFAVSVILQLLAREMPGFGDWYARTVYPLIVGAVGRLSGLFPVSVVELGIYFLIILGVWYVIIHWRQKRKILSRAIFLLVSLFFLFTVNCGINYYRRPFSSGAGLEIRKSSLEELTGLCGELTEAVNQMCQDGASAEMTVSQAEKEGIAAMNRLGKEYPQLAGFYPRAKPLLWSGFFSVQQLCGEYSPFTVEANFNREMPAYNIPHTICHELSHLRGFMREDEANFIGYLACIGSENEPYRYSGYLTGWVYASNALAKRDPEGYLVLCRKLDERAWKDLRENNEFWAKYDGKTAEVSNRLNDTYLKMNNQADGVESYGRMVDLMLAYRRKAGNDGT